MAIGFVNTVRHWRHVLRAARHLGRRDYPQLESEARKMLAVRPSDTLAKTLLATSYDNTRRPHDAARLREEILAVEPGNSTALEGLARYHEREGNLSMACALLRRALALPERDLKLAGWFRSAVLVLARLFGVKQPGEVLDSGIRKNSDRQKEWRAWAEDFVATRCPDQQNDEIVN